MRRFGRRRRGGSSGDTDIDAGKYFGRIVEEKLAGVTGLDADTENGPGWLVRSALDRDLRRDINELARGKGWDLLELSPLRPTLEQAFIELTGRREN